MPRKPSIFRRLVKWLSLLACLVTLAGWGFSARWYRYVVLWDGATQWVSGLGDGRLKVMRVPVFPSASRGYAIQRSLSGETRNFDLGWSLPSVDRIRTSSGAGWNLEIPFWCLFAPSVLLFLLTRSGRRVPLAGYCARCGYDLRGANHERCPECGTPPRAL